MNTIIKTVLLTLLLCIPVAYGMENTITINTSMPPITLKGVTLTDDELAAIICKSDSLKQILTSKEVCKNFYKVINNLILPQAFNHLGKQDVIHALNNLAEKKHNDFYTKMLINKLAKDEYTVPFGTAIKQGDTHVIEAFLKRGIDPNVKANGKTPLSLAIKADQLDAIRLLLRYDANIYESSDNGHSTLRMSLEQACPRRLQEYLGISTGITGDHYPLMIILQEKYGRAKQAIKTTASVASNYCTIL